MQERETVSAVRMHVIRKEAETARTQSRILPLAILHPFGHFASDSTAAEIGDAAMGFRPIDDKTVTRTVEVEHG